MATTEKGSSAQPEILAAFTRNGEPCGVVVKISEIDTRGRYINGLVLEADLSPTVPTND